MTKRILAIINPISGYARSRELPIALKHRIEQENLKLDIHITRAPGDGRNFVKENANGYDLILIAGGDGTISEVVDGLADNHSVPITILPSGTENLFAKEMKITLDIDRIIDTIKWGKEVSMDIIQANNKRFLLVSGIGFDAQVLLHLNSFRTGNITHLTYFWPIWRTFWEYKFPPMSVEVDGEKVIDNQRGLVFVTNIARYSIGLRICKYAKYNDGLLDVCIYLCDEQFELLAHAWRTIWRKHTEHKNVIYRQGKRVKVFSDVQIPFETDGDPAGNLPVEYQIIPSAIRVVVPPCCEPA